jgi:hypothetical protein
MMGGVTDLPPSDPADVPVRDPNPIAEPRSGSTFVVLTGVFLALFLVAILVVGPQLQDRMGLSEGARTFEPPAEVMTVPLEMGDGVSGVATWDADGVCAEVTDAEGTTYRTCAEPDPLRPIWAIDAPDDAVPGYVLVASPPEIANIGGVTTDGESLSGLTQARELPAAWTLIPLEDGAAVRLLVAYNTSSSDVGNAVCGTEESPGGGSERLSGGCFIERQD